MEVEQHIPVYSTNSNSDSKTDLEKDSPTSVHEYDAFPSPNILDVLKERRLVWRIDCRMIPLAMFVYLLCFLNRTNIGNAKVLNSDVGDSLQQSIHLSDQQYRVALVIFIVSYGVFETPSNYLIKMLAPSRWLPIIMLGWGLMTMLLGAVHNYAGLVAIRFFLGAFEAGLFPGLVYCLTFWYKPNERAVRIATISATATLGGAFGGAIAFAIGHMNWVHGLEAWRWLFILEGLPSVLCALLVYFLFPNFPETDKWLSPDERALAVARIAGVSALGHAKITWADARATLLDWRLYLHYFIFIGISVPFSSISLFTPTIVSGLGYEGLSAQLFVVPPYAAAFFVTMVVSWVTDTYECRSWGAICMLVPGGIAFLLQGIIPSGDFKARYALLCVAVAFSFPSVSPLLSWLTGNLRSTGALALAISLNISLGQIGDVVGIYIYKADEAPRYQTGHFTNAAFLLAATVAVLVLRVIYQRRNRALALGERSWLL